MLLIVMVCADPSTPHDTSASDDDVHVVFESGSSYVLVYDTISRWATRIAYCDCTTINIVPTLWMLLAYVYLAYACLNGCVDVMVMAGLAGRVLLDYYTILPSPSNTFILKLDDGYNDYGFMPPFTTIFTFVDNRSLLMRICI